MEEGQRDMPPLVLLALAGAGAIAGYKLFSKLMQQAATPDPAETERIRREAAAAAAGTAAKSRDLGNLEWDEATGAYRPKAPGASNPAS